MLFDPQTVRQLPFVSLDKRRWRKSRCVPNLGGVFSLIQLFASETFSLLTCDHASELPRDECRRQASSGDCWRLTDWDWRDKTKNRHVVPQITGRELRMNENSLNQVLLGWNRLGGCPRVPLAEANLQLSSVGPVAVENFREN
jgi:hypothetical protein